MQDRPWITPFGDLIPDIHPDAFVDVAARVIGDVRVTQDASLWPGAVLRADAAEIRVGRKAAILDQAILDQLADLYQKSRILMIP